MTDTLTYKDISDRCNAAARELTPDMPSANTLEAWEAFSDALEDLDVSDAVWQEVDGWDWSIYTHYGMKIVNVISSDELSAAEAQWHELDGPNVIDESFGVYEFAAKVAYFFLTAKLTETVQELVDELQELAQNEMENANG